MNIKDLANCATAASAPILIESTSSGYSFSVLFKGDNYPIRCTTQRGKDRLWKSLDVLVKHLREARFVGKVEMMMHQQIDLI